MNIFSFLTPKAEVAYLYNDFSIRQALEKMEYHHYSRIPVLNRDGEYIGDITEGDLLWFIKSKNLNMASIEILGISEIPQTKKLDKITIDSSFDDLLEIIINQNYVPVVDDRNKFIGIITRTKVMSHLYKKEN
jgi:CBS domain-containing protein